MTVEEYLKLPYAVDIRWDADDEIFVARVAEIPDCTGHGSSRSDAMEMALDNLRDWIEDALETRQNIPEPAPLESLPSGKWVQRVPRHIHAELVSLANSDGVSLNQLVVSILSRELGYRSGIQRQQTIDVSASVDPSTACWSEAFAEIAVSKTWHIDDPLRVNLINPSFVDQLVDRLPNRLTMKDRDLRKHDKEIEHKNWN